MVVVSPRVVVEAAVAVVVALAASLRPPAVGELAAVLSGSMHTTAPLPSSGVKFRSQRAGPAVPAALEERVSLEVMGVAAADQTFLTVLEGAGPEEPVGAAPAEEAAGLAVLQSESFERGRVRHPSLALLSNFLRRTTGGWTRRWAAAVAPVAPEVDSEMGLETVLRERQVLRGALGATVAWD